MKFLRKFKETSLLLPSSIFVRAFMAALLAMPIYSGVAKADITQTVTEDWIDDAPLDLEPSFDRSFARQWETFPPRGFPTLAKNNVGRMKAAIKRYSAIVSQGGWRPLPMVKLRVGVSHQAVRLLRHRLQVTGDLAQQSGFADTFDFYVEKALKRFQIRHGLTPSGMVDKTTVAALNVPAIARLRQLRTNLVRVKTHSAAAADRYVMVNIPAQQIEAVEGGRVVSRHSGVVGKIDRQTPLLKSKIHEINFNPFWTVPKSIIRKDLVPKGREYSRRGKDILDVYKMNVFDKKGRKLDPSEVNWFSDEVLNYTFRQDPWAENSMGFVKINFHNKHAVFMHDTPTKSLFGRNYRAESSGCIRVQNVQQLVSWLLRDNGDWNNTRISGVKRTGERVDVRLKARVPVYFVYLTSWVTEDGMVNFRRDLYRRDNVDITASVY